MLEFKKPIPVVVEGDKDGYAIYVSNSGAFENDIWCVTLCDGGAVRHYRSDQIKIYHNETLDLRKHTEGTEYPELEGLVNLCKDMITSRLSQTVPPKNDELETVKRAKKYHVKAHQWDIAALYREIEKLLEQKQ